MLLRQTAIATISLPLLLAPVSAKPEAGAAPASPSGATLVRTAQADAAAPASTEPQKTSATFGDWIVRCDRSGTPAKKVCEAVQTFSIKGQQAPFAQIVFAHVPAAQGAAPATDGSMTMLLILPVNLSLDKQPSLSTGSETKTIPLLRCLPEGCVASAPAGADLVKQLRSAKSASAAFFDAAGQKVNLPLSPKGFPQAIDNLGKEMSSRS